MPCIFFRKAATGIGAVSSGPKAGDKADSPGPPAPGDPDRGAAHIIYNLPQKVSFTKRIMFFVQVYRYYFFGKKKPGLSYLLKVSII